MASPIESLPQELLDMIIKATDSKNEPVLNAEEFSNLRISSKTLEINVHDEFAKRFFTKRKHMLSRASLQCLLDISASPKFSSNVEEVNIGPERINSGLLMSLAAADKERFQRKRDRLAAWREFVEEQKTFDNSGQEQRMLEKSLHGFRNLKHVHIDSYPDDTDQVAWSRAWGAKSILRRLGIDVSEEHASPNARYSLVDENNGLSTLHSHYKRVMGALRGIRSDNKDWTLEFSFHPMCLHYEREPFDLDRSGLYDVYRGRVRAVNLSQVFFGEARYFSESWVSRFLNACNNLESLTLEDESAAFLYEDILIPKLRHLTDRGGRLAYDVFPQFLADHADTLETITLEGPHMTIYAKGFNASMNDTGIYPSWFDVFGIMLKMPHLSHLHLSGLTEDSARSFCAPYFKCEPRRIPGSTLVTVSDGEIATQLNRAIAAGFVKTFEDTEERVKVWFPADN